MDRKLYHYTNLESLALIISFNSIKFNNLSNMDDLEEGLSSDVKNISKYCFISSWTDEKEESIPMWNMYSGLGGVRISLPRNPFSMYKWRDPLKCEEIIESVFSEKDLFNDTMYPMIQDEILFEVRYTDDINILYPEVKEYVQNGFHLNLSKLGRNKRSSWSFQKEWRYALYFYPISLKEMISNIEKGKRKLRENIFSGNNLLPSSVFLKIRKECMDELEILCGPKMGPGSRVLLECLVKKYCPRAKVTTSNLKLR